MGCLHGDTRIYKWQKLFLTIIRKTHELLVEMSINLLNPTILGHNWLYIKELLWEVTSEQGLLRGPRSFSKLDEEMMGKEEKKDTFLEAEVEPLDI